MLYQLFGIATDSDLPLPLPLVESGRADVKIACGRVDIDGDLVWASAPDQPAFACYRGAADNPVLLDWPGARFAVTRTSVVIDTRDQALAISLLLQPVWSVMLAAHQREPLHGAAIGCDGGAIAVLGASGTGKSTAAARLIDRGWQLITDDLLVIDDADLVVPGPPFMRLTADGPDRGAEDVGADRKRRVRYPTAAAMPLAAAVVLDDRYRQWDRLQGSDAVGALLNQVYNPIGLFAGQAQRRLDLALRIVEQVPLYGAPSRSIEPDRLEAIVHEAAQ